jgi:hypothetical protein
MAAMSGPDRSDSGVDFLRTIPPLDLQVRQERQHFVFAVQASPVESDRDVIWRWLSRDLASFLYPFVERACWLGRTHTSSIPAWEAGEPTGYGLARVDAVSNDPPDVFAEPDLVRRERESRNLKRTSARWALRFAAQ